jgi:nucleotide-binding universal stress UspA family protein
MYKTIVVGTDGSDTASQAVETAAHLAREGHSKLHIVTAFSDSISGMAAASGFYLADSGFGRQAHQEAAGQVAGEARARFAAGVETEVHAVNRSPVDAIVDTAESVDADLIVVGSKGMTGARRVLGSVPNSVAHSAPCAVLIVKTA